MKESTALALAKNLKTALLQKGVPVETMYLYGSTVRGTQREDSDIDIAVVCQPFRDSRLDENVEVSKARWDIDLRIETFVLHPDDFKNEYCMIAQEVKKDGITV